MSLFADLFTDVDRRSVPPMIVAVTTVLHRIEPDPPALQNTNSLVTLCTRGAYPKLHQQPARHSSEWTSWTLSLRCVSCREFNRTFPVMVGSNADYFEQHKPLVRLSTSGPLVRTASHTVGDDGLRRGQLGAAFAVAAHFTCRTEAALVCMPTGSGKSAVMTLVPFLLGASRVLVVTPSRLLREQLAAEFLLLKVLRTRKVVPEEMNGPRVQVVSTRADAAAWQAMRNFDVVVGTVNVFSPAYDGVTAPAEGLFDLVLVDEAHHSISPTYQRLLETLAGVPVVMFTATPFRRDKHQLPATSVYTYSLGQALDDGVLAAIDFVPVDLPVGASDQLYDTALARAAAGTLALPEHQGARSRVIARTRTVEHARELVEVYREAGVPVGLITASTSAREVRRTLGRLDVGDLMGLVSVGVLGEGFDFPTLKVGVYHRRHASLPATLQFLGRLTRIVPNGPRACLLAVREEVNDETHELYANDMAWARLVPALADAAVDTEARRRTYLRSFDPDPTRPLSLSALVPRKDVKVFRLPPGVEVNLRAPVETLGGGEVIYHGTDDDGDLTVIVTEHLDRPEWMASDTLDRYRYELHLAVRDTSGTHLFVHGTRDLTIRALVERLAGTELRQVDPEWLDRLMAGMHLISYHSVGMRSARAAGGRQAAYRMMAGTNVGGAVLPAETRSYGTGHAIAQVRDPLGQRTELNGLPPVTSVGVSFGRAKVFSPDHAQLLDFRNWCNRLAELVAERGDSQVTGLPNLPLRSPRSIGEFPENPYLVALEPRSPAPGMARTQRGDGRLPSASRTTTHCHQIRAGSPRPDGESVRCSGVEGMDQHPGQGALGRRGLDHRATCQPRERIHSDIPQPRPTLRVLRRRLQHHRSRSLPGQ